MVDYCKCNTVEEMFFDPDKPDSPDQCMKCGKPVKGLKQIEPARTGLILGDNEKK